VIFNNLTTDKIPHHVPQILINMELLPHMANFDVALLGPSDKIVHYICQKLGWELESHGSTSKNVKNDKNIRERSVNEDDSFSYEYHGQGRYIFPGGIIKTLSHERQELYMESASISSETSIEEREVVVEEEIDENKKVEEEENGEEEVDESEEGKKKVECE